MFTNVGAMYKSDMKDIPTKTALKRAFVEDPANVILYDTSEMSDKKSRTGTNLDNGVKYSVVGPNPYTSRKWYATVEKTAKGIKVS